LTTCYTVVAIRIESSSENRPSVAFHSRRWRVWNIQHISDFRAAGAGDSERAPARVSDSESKHHFQVTAPSHGSFFRQLPGLTPRLQNQGDKLLRARRRCGSDRADTVTGTGRGQPASEPQCARPGPGGPARVLGLSSLVLVFKFKFKFTIHRQVSVPPASQTRTRSLGSPAACGLATGSDRRS
jgi:hypothetical protein